MTPCQDGSVSPHARLFLIQERALGDSVRPKVFTEGGQRERQREREGEGGREEESKRKINLWQLISSHCQR